jgi:hypothetical protein
MSESICQVKELRKSIENFLIQFDILIEKYGFTHSYRVLRSQYRDVCSRGDVVINEMLDGLVSDDVSYYVSWMEENKSNSSEVKRIIDDYLIETVQELAVQV